MKCSIVDKKAFLMIYLADPHLVGHVPTELLKSYFEEGLLDQDNRLTDRGREWLETVSCTCRSSYSWRCNQRGTARSLRICRRFEVKEDKQMPFVYFLLFCDLRRRIFYEDLVDHGIENNQTTVG